MDNSPTTAFSISNDHPEIPQPSSREQAERVWSACLDQIRERVNSQSFKTWFEPIVPQQLDGGVLTVQVPSQFFYDWLDEHYCTIINSTVTDVLGKVAHLEYSIRTDESPVDLEYVPPVLPVRPSRPAVQSQPEP